MDKELITFISYNDICKLQFNDNGVRISHFTDLINNNLNKIKDIRNNIRNFINFNKDKFYFASYDNIVVYYDDDVDYIKIGKWSDDTLTRHNDYHNFKTSIDFNVLTQKINYFIKNKYKENEIRLQKQDSIGREPNVYRGTAIEVPRISPCIENGSSGYTGKACIG